MKAKNTYALGITAVLVATVCCSTSATGALLPTDYEQYQLELVNRARANPNAEVTRLSSSAWGDRGSPATPNLNEGLPLGTITATAKQPLAFNPRLMQAARDYSNTLLTNNAFQHDFGGTTLGSRTAAAGYVSSPTPSGVGENLSVSASSGPYVINTETSEQLYNQLFIDGNVAGRGHRINILDPDWREIGIGLGQSTTYSGIGAGFPNAVLVTQNFAYTNSTPFLTGVVYNDSIVDNDFYTPGEGLGGITVNAYQSGTSFLAASTTTYSTGGYSLAVDPGAYDVQFVNGSGGIFTATANWSGANNFKLDAVNPVFAAIPEPQTWAMVLAGVAILGGARLSKSRPT